MVANVRRVPEVERRTVNRLCPEAAEVRELDTRTTGETGRCEMATREDCGERIEFDRNERCPVEATTGGNRKPARPSPWIDDAGRLELGRCPGDYRLNDRERRVCGAVRSALLGRAQGAERIA